MRKYKTKKIKIEKKELIKVICDFCEKEISESLVRYKGFGQIKISFGYPSDFDMLYFEGEICDDCFRTLFKEKLREEKMEFI
jgi:hypothetical protein